MARWQEELQEAPGTPEALAAALHREGPLATGVRQAAAAFPVLVPRSFLALADPRDPSDPILRQVEPDPAESLEVEGYEDDPTADGPARLAPGLLVKYPGRALLMPTGRCAVACRFCFRRAFLPAGDRLTGGALEEACAAIEADPSLQEVILSGGDPLVLPDPALAGLLRRLVRIRHVTLLRVHTRVPVVLPSRVDDDLARLLSRTGRPLFMVIHANHPRELSAEVQAALGRLADAGIPLLAQSVLLRGVNDDADTLARLLEGLLRCRTRPYYLHQLDRARGTAHFRVPDEEALDLMEQVRSRVSGLALPRLVVERPGAPSKVPLWREAVPAGVP